jgi:hypothetical protein
MIPVLHSIDSLLNRFDELSQRHASFVSNFDTNFSDTENPLRDVTRSEEEQRKTTESLLKSTNENNDQMSSFGTVEDFNRRIIKSRGHNRPPSYSSNDSSSLFHRFPSRSSFATTESAPPPRTSTSAMIQATLNASVLQSVASSSIENLTEPKTRLKTNIKPKVIPQNPSPIRRYARSAITVFTIETVNRLSRPRTYHQSPEQKVSPKRVHRRPRIYQSIKKKVPPEPSVPLPPRPEPSVSLPPPPPPRSPQKRAYQRIIKSAPIILKSDDKFPINNSKRIPVSNYPRQAIFLAAPPTIALTFPMQPELKSSRVVVIPKAPITTHKTINIFTNRRSIIAPNRMIQLMT